MLKSWFSGAVFSELCGSVKLLISPSYLNEILAGYSNLDCRFFFHHFGREGPPACPASLGGRRACPVPARAAGKEGKLGRPPGPAGGRLAGRPWRRRRSGNLTRWRQQLVGFPQLELTVAKGPGFGQRRPPGGVSRAGVREEGPVGRGFGGRKRGGILSQAREAGLGRKVCQA